MAQLKLEIGAVPATPATGTVTMYPKSDKKIYFKDDTGLETGIAPFTPAPGDYTASEITNVPGGNITATDVQAAINELDTEKAPLTHVGSTGISEHGVVSGVVAGFMSPSDKTKLDGIESAATANSTDLYLLSRTNHTGTQLASTISDFDEASQDAIALALTDTTTIDLTYNDVGGTITADVNPGSIGDSHLGTGINANKISSGNITNTEFNYLDGVTSSIQTQIDTKVTKTGDSMSGGLTFTDTAGNGFTQYSPQSPVPATPSSGYRQYSGSTGRIAFKGTSGIPWSLDYLGLTATRVFTFPDQTGTLMIDPATTIGDTLYRNSSNVTDRLPIGSDAYIYRVVSGVPAWSTENLLQDFGDGSDGNLTVSGALTLTQIPYYNTLTITAGAALNTAGYPIYCKVLDLTNAPAGSIFRNGNNGANTAVNTGGAAGTALTAAFLGGSAAGSAGAAGASNAGTASAAPGSTNPGNGGTAGNSGASGAGGTGAGVAAGAGGTASNYIHFGRFEQNLLRGGSLILGGSGGDGGNSGGGDGANTSRGGGGGGSGGGVIAIYAAEIITGPSTPAGVIQAKGGNGGKQTSAPAAGSCGGAGGSGGGGGGYIYIAYIKKTGATVTSLLDASGGNGGDGSNGSGTGAGGNGGQSGSGGQIQIFNATTATGTQVIGTAGTNGTAASGLTGGLGANGGSSVLSL